MAQCTQISLTHAKTGLKRPRKEWQWKGFAEGGGGYAEATKEIEIEQGDHGGVPIGRPNAADAHAGERCGKRIRTSASGIDAGTTTW